MKKWKQLVAGFMVVVGMGASVMTAQPVSAVNVFDQCSGNADSSVCKAQGNDNAASMIKIVINILLFLVGTVSVIMIIVGGIRYTTSNGNASQVKEAKDTIIYAVVGLIVSLMAYAIVNFVVSWF
jgi:hypothetical protein